MFSSPRDWEAGSNVNTHTLYFTAADGGIAILSELIESGNDLCIFFAVINQLHGILGRRFAS